MQANCAYENSFFKPMLINLTAESGDMEIDQFMDKNDFTP